MDIYDSLRKGKRKSSNPKAVLFCGSSGTGKTTLRNHFLMKSMIVFDADELWNTYKRNDVGTLLIDALHSAISDKYNVLYDGTCRNHQRTIDILDKLKQNGYHTTLVVTYTKPITALHRVRERKTQDVPEHVAKQIFLDVSKHIKHYMDYPDEVYLYNNEHEPTLIFHRKEKTIRCLAPDMDFYFDVSEYCK